MKFLRKNSMKKNWGKLSKIDDEGDEGVQYDCPHHQPIEYYIERWPKNAQAILSREIGELLVWLC